MTRRTPGPIRRFEESSDSIQSPDASQWPIRNPRPTDAPAREMGARPQPQDHEALVASCQAEIASLTEQSMAATDPSQREQKRAIDYALALAYQDLGELLLGECERAGAVDEVRAESAMSCFSDAATIFHELGAEDEKDQALRQARRAHELYSN